jgi:hypothetical protein
MSSTGVLDAMLGVMFGQGPGVFGGHGSRSLFDNSGVTFDYVSRNEETFFILVRMTVSFATIAR